MNTLIDDNIKKLLYEKGWRYDLSTQGHRVKHSLGEARFNDGNFCYVDISIAEIVMWLYEKHGIWINVSLNQFSKPKDLQWMYSIVFIKDCTYSHSPKSYNSPIEACEAAIIYVLNN